MTKPKAHRWGTFHFTLEQLEDQPNLIKLALKQCRVISRKYDGDQGIVRFTAYHPRFELITHCQPLPNYTWYATLIDKETHQVLSVDFVQDKELQKSLS